MSDQPTRGTYSLEVIAQVLLLTPQRVGQLVKEGVLLRSARNSYELVPCVHAYIRFLREHATGGNLKGGGDIAASKARMINARARLAEAEADIADGTAIPRRQVEEAWQRLLGNFRLRLLALPSKTAPMIHTATTLAEASNILTNAVHDALDELSRTPIYTTERADSGRLAGPDRGSNGVNSNAATAAEADDLAMG